MQRRTGQRRTGCPGFAAADRASLFFRPGLNVEEECTEPERGRRGAGDRPLDYFGKADLLEERERIKTAPERTDKNVRLDKRGGLADRLDAMTEERTRRTRADERSANYRKDGKTYERTDYWSEEGTDEGTNGRIGVRGERTHDRSNVRRDGCGQAHAFGRTCTDWFPIQFIWIRDKVLNHR